MRMRLPFAAILLSILPLTAQERAQLWGFIGDSTNAAVAGASVIAVNEDNGFRRAVESRRDGSYEIVSLRPGMYKLTVRKEGFRTIVQFGVKLEVAQSGRVDFALQVGSTHETVTVESAPLLLNGSDAAVSTLVGRDWIDHLPLQGHGLLALMELAPGSLITSATGGEAGQFTVNGQRPNTNSFAVDGVSANSGVGGGALPAQLAGGSLPNMTAFGSLHSLAAVEALDEFRMQTSTLNPETGSMPGAQISLSTRSGSNELHGSLFDIAANEALDANDWFANRNGDPRAPYRFQDFGGTLGGPIRRDRTFYFLSYEGLRLEQPYVFRAPLPSLELRAQAPPLLQPALNLFPLPNGPVLGSGLQEWTGRSTRPSSLDSGSLRVDHAISSRFLFFGRYNGAPSQTEFNYLSINHFSLGWQSATLGLNAALTPNALNEFRAGFSSAVGDSQWRQFGQTGPPPCYIDALTFNTSAPCESFFRLSIGGVGDLLGGSNTSNRQGQRSVTDTFSLSRPAHQLRFGIGYRRLTPWRNSPPSSVNIAAGDITSFLNSSFAVTVSQAQQAASQIQNFSAFAQDTWHAAPRLTLTYGVRWELSPAPRVAAPPLTASGTIANPDLIPIWQIRYTDFAPRVGAAYRITGDGRTVVRAGAGLYFDPDFGVATDGVNGAPYNSWQFHSPSFALAFVPSVSLLTYAFAPDLRVPMIWEWNAMVERAWTPRDVFSIGYVGSAGRQLLRREVGQGSSSLIQISVATNHGNSDYEALQLQYRRRVAAGLRSIVSYSWSHSIDNGSADDAVYFMLRGRTSDSDRGSSDFDVRHSFTTAVSYEFPSILKRWALDGIFRARTGFPVDILQAETALGASYANLFRPDLVYGVPVWLSDPDAPGGARINPAAFLSSGNQGNLGRNAVTGFGMSQLDLTLRRNFLLSERRSIELRLEAFNALNQANLADPVRFLVSPLFGESSSMLNLMLGSGSPGRGLTPAFQIGGARSLQLGLRFHF